MQYMLDEDVQSLRAVLKNVDHDRIKSIGRKYLLLAVEKELDGDKLSRFLRNVIEYEQNI